MSLSQDRPTNPTSKRLRISGGAVSYWDRDSQSSVELPMPLEFIVLDQLSTVKGWSDSDNSGYWSNEVRSVGKDELAVRTNAGLKEKGLWKDIKNSPSLSGAKYHTSIYMAVVFNGEMQIANLAIAGAALNAWIDFSKKTNLHNSKVVLSGWSDEKKGAVKYKVPIFEAQPMGAEEKESAVGLDKELQEYLEGYFSYDPKQEQTSVLDVPSEEPIDLSEIPF